MIQRVLDIIFCSTAIILLLPVIFPILIILRFTGEGEILYKQKRVGMYGKEFILFKFATMLKNSPSMGAGDITLHNDPRVLPFGTFLRKTKINELPQLLNILNGDMSIVGPRPMVPKTYSKYSKSARLIMNTVRPGLTGIGSIFFRDEEKFLSNNKDSMDFYQTTIIPYKSLLELWFVDNNSIYLYFKIIIVTVWVVLFPKSKNYLYFFKELPKKPDSLVI
ncbi:MAG: lipid carrier--UDP-N-acetylgalactosaminyltransferase [Flavobacteriales bacterium]|nr:lipid carrier--UDP-N-acetylgalactosaminyltransferase [Flavobacteriales bacterium]|tara:strand:+ start:143 stop:805 length:663 start_codon:yes stop_codon:yes gene_type:complete